MFNLTVVLEVIIAPSSTISPSTSALVVTTSTVITISTTPNISITPNITVGASDDEDDLSGGEIAAIVIGSVFGAAVILAVITGVAFWYVCA